MYTWSKEALSPELVVKKLCSVKQNESGTNVVVRWYGAEEDEEVEDVVEDMLRRDERDRGNIQRKQAEW